jgi:2-keto-4-pentenoate hydratase/2-oxohepta-3-ene-1,7-dioic acid hydratase in catechol pathway
MKLVSFAIDKDARPRWGALLDGGHVLDLTAALLASGLEAPADHLAYFDLDGPYLAKSRAGAATWSGNASLVRGPGSYRLLSPVPRPGKVVCIGLNYRDHAKEQNIEPPKTPIVFSKFPTCIAAPETPIRLGSSQKVDWEAELAVVIGRRAKGVKKEQAYDYVLGYACFNDVSARDFQFADGQWQRGKSCDTHGPFGPYILTADEVKDPHALRIALRVNGETMQDSSTAQMIFGVPELVEWISENITLEPGDVIATGTPPGVGFARKPSVYLKAGDVAEVEIEGLGVLRNPVRA